MDSLNIITNNNNTLHQKELKLLKSNLFLIFISLIIFLSFVLFWYLTLSTQYDKYWGREDLKPQGTIFSTQTVQINLATYSYPYIIASLLKENKIKEIDEYLYGLFYFGGFVITSCAKESQKNKCINEKIVTYNKKAWWLNLNNIREYIKNSDYNILTDNHSIGIDWTYNKPKDHSITDLDFEPRGNIIGRLYYVRKPRPQFWSLLKEWAYEENFSSSSTSKKYLAAFSFLFLFAFISVLVGLFLLKMLLIQKITNRIDVDFSEKYKKIKNEEIKQLQREMSDEKIKIRILERERLDLIKNKDDIKSKLKGNEIEKNNLLNKIEILYSQSEVDDLINDIDGENKSLLSKISNYKSELNKNKSNMDKLLNNLSGVRKERDRHKKEYKNLLKNTPVKGKNIHSDVFIQLINGMNSHSKYDIQYHNDVITSDFYELDKSGYTSSEISHITINSIMEYTNRGSTNSIIQKLNDNKVDIYHNKKDRIRIYFSHIRNINVIYIIAIWSSDNSMHYKNDSSYKKLKNKLESRITSFT